MKKRILIALVVVLALAATASLVWATGDLTSYWPFDGTANDIVNGNHGTPHGDAAYADGKFGQALSLDGDGDYVSIPDSTSLDLSGEMTVEAWIKVAVHKNYNAIVIKGEDVAENYELLLYADGRLHSPIKFTDGSRTYLNASGAITDNNWHHVAMTYKPGQWIIYVDGEKKAERTDISKTPLTNNIPLFIGAEQYLGSFRTERFFNGDIDEVGIWNRALSPEEIAALSVGVGSLEWLPPINLPDWTLNENATLPIKFKLYDPIGDLICADLDPTLEVNSGSLELRFDSECYYIANFRPTESGGHMAVVSLDGVELGSQPFDVLEPGKGNGKGRGSNN